MTRAEALDDLTLMLAYLTSWTEKVGPGSVRIAWKGYAFDVLDDLAEQGLISQSKRSKSMYISEEGEERALELMKKYGISIDDE